MSAFKALKDASNNFEEELRHVSGQLFSSKIGETFEDGISKKLRDLSLYTSKTRFLQAKPISLTPQVTEVDKDESVVLKEFGDQVMWRLVEQQTVKSLVQAHTVRTLVTTPDRLLDPELVERKGKIIKLCSEYREQESMLQHLDTILKDKESELAEVRVRWDREIGELRDMRAASGSVEEVEVSGPLYKKLCGLINKLELMRWLINKLVTPRTRGYDWLSDPRRRLAALKLARPANTVDMFLEDNC